MSVGNIARISMFAYSAQKLVFGGITAVSYILIPGLIMYLPVTLVYKGALYGDLLEFILTLKHQYVYRNFSTTPNLNTSTCSLLNSSTRSLFTIYP